MDYLVKYNDPSKMVLIEKSWEDIIHEFLNSADLKESTINSYKRRLRRWLRWIESKKLTNPTTNDLVDFKKYILKECSSSLTCTNYLTAIKSLYKWTHRRGIAPNITEEIRTPIKPRSHTKDSLEIEQVKKLLSSIETKSLKGKRDYALCRLLIATGLRGIEVHRANIEDIKKVNGKWLLYVHGKGRDDKSEFVVLMPNVLNAIEDYLLYGSHKERKGPLFKSMSSNYQGRLSTRSLRGIVKARLRNIGIDSIRISAHSMRHSSITISLLGGSGLQETKELARHSSIDTTLRYAHNLKLLSNPAFESIDTMIESNKDDDLLD
jgi:integrase/recombinase XerD